MPPPRTLRRVAIALAIVLIAALYLADLTGMGIVGPDEPRYASIGRAMAQSGDWITPTLWGSPWFEKPALLYWMVGVGFRLGLNPDLAPRLPVALLSVAFLAVFFWRLRIEWDESVAAIATSVVATSAGWLAYSHVAVTDLPLAAFFSAALLFALPWISRGDRTLLPLAGACLGIATLAKGLVPLVLFVPVLVLNWRRLADCFRPLVLAAFAACALPWYVLCTLRNGSTFLQVFFVEQQFGRFSSAALQHVQPWWYYIPVALLLLFPWAPALFFTAKGTSDSLLRDPRLRTLAAVAAFGFVFFSASVNKLPSYILPLLPATVVLFAVPAAGRPQVRLLLIPAALLGLLPQLPAVVATSLAHGLRAAQIPWTAIAASVVAAALAGWLLTAKLPAGRAFSFVAAGTAIGFVWFQVQAFPQIDAAASSRPAWIAEYPSCVAAKPRNFAYGLYYYSGRMLPECHRLDRTQGAEVR